MIPKKMKYLLTSLLCGIVLISGPVFAAEPQPTPPAAQEIGYWLSATGKRHNSKCRYYQKTKGIPCRETDGVACKVCGG